MTDWIDCGLPYRTYGDKEPSFEDTLGFDNLPGLLIETEHGLSLIGHINAMRGVCDDCTDFGADTVVIRYKRVWAADQPTVAP